MLRSKASATRSSRRLSPLSAPPGFGRSSGVIGSAAQALGAGTPQLVVAWALDQFSTADQIERLGAGRALRLRRFTAARVAQLVQDLLQTPRNHTTYASFSARIAAEDGVATLCDAIGEVIA